METVTVEHVKEAMESPEEVALINVLSEDEFMKEHIPGSINIPIKIDEDFAQKVEEVVPSKGYHIIVYCSGPVCNASEQAAKELDKVGFSFVMRFKGGMQEWKEAGEPVKSGM
jgi:rhodanese-related sulfurtransferase